MRMSNSWRSAAERQASLPSCDSSHPQNKNDGSLIRRSPKVQETEAEMTQAKERQSPTKKQRTDNRRGGLRRHETQTNSSHAPSENSYTKDRQDRLDAPRRTIG